VTEDSSIAIAMILNMTLCAMVRGRPIQCRRGRTWIKYFSLVADADWQRILGQNLRTDANSKISGSAHLWPEWCKT